MDNVLKMASGKFLIDAGKVRHTQALEKAKVKYQKYVVQNLAPVEEVNFTILSESPAKSGSPC